jgi:hypothetical protein
MGKRQILFTTKAPRHKVTKEKTSEPPMDADKEEE